MNKTGALGDIFHHFDITQSGISLQDFLRENTQNRPRGTSHAHDEEMIHDVIFQNESPVNQLAYVYTFALNANKSCTFSVRDL